MRRPVVILALTVAASLLVPAAAARAQPSVPENPIPGWNDCFQGLAAPGPSGELYGPTDINAQSANGRLAVALNEAGTVTVLKWPRPSYYDQVKYRTSSRAEPYLGALPNEGAFLGLAVTTADATRTVWLRDLPATQRHPDDLSDVVETTYDAADLGLAVVVRDVVAPDDDVLHRAVTVTRSGDSPVTEARLIAFENFNLVVSKWPYGPVQDWCFEEENTDTATYDPEADVIVHEKSGMDRSTGRPSSAAVAMGFAGASSQHQVGGDAHEGTAAPAGRVPGPTQDAYDDAADGMLSGGTSYTGQTTGALAAALAFDRGVARATLLVAGGADRQAATQTLDAARDRDIDEVVAAKRAWFDDLLDDAPLPATDDETILAVAKRALVTLVSVYDLQSGAIVASIATQSPYGEDWIRDGAFFNHALDLIGRHDWVATRNRWYAAIQSQGQLGADNPFADVFGQAFVPPGNWAMNYYADGVVGGPIPWEIDETGYGLWAFWDHYAATGDTEELRAVYPAVRRAADFLTDCTDPTNGLHCRTWEDDNPQPRQTIHGAGPVWLGLDAAVRAAEALGETGDADRWTARRAELRDAIESNLYADGAYGGGNGVIVWPVCFHGYDHPRFEPSQYEAVWERLAPTFREPRPGPPVAGLYESKGLIALAKAKKDDPAWLARVRGGLEWIATHHAQPGTHIMGEEWFQQGDTVISTVSQPHVWEQILFYLSAIEAYPPADVEGAGTASCGGTIAALRGDVAPTAGGDTPTSGPSDDGRSAPPAQGDRAADALPATGPDVPAGGLAALALAAVTFAARTRRRRT